MEPALLRSPLKKAHSYTAQLEALRSHFFPAAAVRTARNFFSDDSVTESSVYKHVLKSQRPSTVDFGYLESFSNSVSLIGKIEKPFKRVNRDGWLGVHTMLDVKPSRHCSTSFPIMLKMWNETAALSLEHFKRNDLVYVCGHLRSYTKSDKNGSRTVRHEVVVQEINYVAQLGPVEETNQKDGKTKSKASEKEILDVQQDRIYLWQVFFASPHEWWDNRKNKVNPRIPDFKHKDTGEGLWLHRDDPPWIKRQLELHDSRSVNGCWHQGRSTSGLSPMVYIDQP